MTYLLDTNICIALLKGLDPKLAKKILDKTPEEFSLCSVVKAELLFGARKSQHVEKNIELLRTFFARFDSHFFDDKAAEQYGLIRAALEKMGTPIGANDLMIASIVLVNDLVLLTRNRHEFSRVPLLRTEEW